MKKKCCLCLWPFAVVFLILPGASLGQESVDVPQLLQKDVHTFKLTINSLESLAANIRDHTETVMQELQIVQKKMQLLPKDSRTYRLQHKQYEEKLSEYWARKFVMLQEMQDLRLRTLASLDNVLSQLHSTDTQTDTRLLDQVQEEIRKADDRNSQTRLEMLQILDKLKQPDIRFEEKQRLMRKFHLLQNENLALYDAHRRRLTELYKLAEQPNGELPAMRQALLIIRDDLDSRYAWVETEMTYLSLYANYRQNWLNTDARIVEVSGLVERFRDMVTQLNANRDLMGEVEDFAKQLRPVPDTSSLFIELPPLQWPGKPAQPAGFREMTEAEIDSMRQALEQELKSTTRMHAKQ